MENSFLIANALLYDGSGNKPFMADVAVENGVITDVCKPGESSKSMKVIEANGAVLAPGFIDVHTHADYDLMYKTPTADNYVAEGTTTSIIGNCGFNYSDAIIRDFPAYEKAFYEKHPSQNIAVLVGHNTLRGMFMGTENRLATKQEAEKMRDALKKCLDAGAVGMSSGLWYIPGKYSDTEEVKIVASALKGTGKPYATHMRSERLPLLDSIREAVEIAKSGDNKLEISHFKTYGASCWHLIDDALELVEQYRAAGVKIQADRYPYLYSETGLHLLLPAPYDLIADVSAYLKANPGEKANIIEAFKAAGGPECPFNKVILLYAHNPAVKPYLGKTVAEAAKMMGREEYDAYLWLLETDFIQAAFGVMCIENLRKIYARDWVVVGSDSTIQPYNQVISHPRAYGTMPRFFRFACESSRPEKVIRRMTSATAEFFNLKNRGLVKPGYCADLVLFRPDEFSADENYGHPNVFPKGIDKTFVNGVMVFEHGAGFNREPGGGQFLKY